MRPLAFLSFFNRGQRYGPIRLARWQSLGLDDRSTKTMIGVVLLMIINQFCFSLLEVPRVRLFEKIICRDHYLRGEHAMSALKLAAEETLCKIPEIQSELATVLGYKCAFDSIPGLVMAKHFGDRADSSGRKPVVMLALLGELLALIWIMTICYYHTIFPFRMVWLSSAFLFLGGGLRILLSMLFSIVTDTVPANVRSRFMYLNTGIAAVSSITAPPIAERLLGISTWTAFQVAIVLSVVCIPIVLFMPADLQSPTNEEKEKLDIPLTDIKAEQAHPLNASIPKYTSILPITSQPTANASPGATNPLFTRPLIIAYLMFSFKRTGLMALTFIYQHVSRTFDWTIPQTARLQLVRGIGATVITTMVLPGLSTFVIRRQILKPHDLDLHIVRMSATSISAALLIFWLARSSSALYGSVLLIGLSEGLEPALQGLATSLIDPSWVARMFTTIARYDLLARIVFGPAMASLLFVGHSAKGDGIWRLEGLCFLIASGVFAIVAGLAWRFKVH